MSENAFHRFHVSALRSHLTRAGVDCEFGDVVFKVSCVRLKPDDARLQGVPATSLLLLAIVEDVSVPPPRRGDDVLVSGRNHRVASIPVPYVAGTFELIVTPS